MSTRGVAVLIAVCLLLATSGCGDDEAKVSFNAQRIAESGEMPSYQVRFDDGKRTHEIAPEQFRANNIVGPFDTENHGSLRIEFEAQDEENILLAEGSVVLDLRKDWGWSVVLTIAEQSPEDGCFGCVGTSEFELNKGSGLPDTYKLYVTWGGNSISDPVVY
jgi:hypothetical protein